MPRRKLDRPNYRKRWVAGKRGGSWYIDWTEGGKPKSISARTADAAEADAEIQRLSAHNEKVRAPQEPTIAEILDGYIADRTGHVEDIGRINYARRPIVRHIGALTPVQLSRRAYWDHRRRESVADGTITREIIVLRAALKWAYREKWISSEVSIAAPPKGHGRERWLTREEADQLIRATRAPHLRLFILLALHTAARRGAILDVTWDRVDLEKRLIHFRRPGRAETKKRRITVPINDALIGPLQAAREVAITEYVIEYRGRKAGNIRHAFERSVQRAGIAYCTRHDLRRTAATWLVMAGIPLEKVAAMLGDTKEMIERHYGKWAPDYLRSAADALAGNTALKAIDSETTNFQGSKRGAK